MTDYFALLDEPRRPWLDAESLKSKFLTRSSEVHPDRVHDATESEKLAASRRYAELNSAFSCLREPKTRLRHLLELELGAKPDDLQEIPPGLADLFLEVARLRRQGDAFLAERARVQSPLLRVQFLERTQEWVDRLSVMQRRLGEHQKVILAELQTLDAAWPQANADEVARARLLKQLEEIHRLLSFHTRWAAQIQESVVQLAL